SLGPRNPVLPPQEVPHRAEDLRDREGLKPAPPPRLVLIRRPHQGEPSLRLHIFHEPGRGTRKLPLSGQGDQRDMPLDQLVPAHPCHASPVSIRRIVVSLTRK